MKKRVLKNWVVKVLGLVLVSYFLVVTTTIENIGNTNYNIFLGVSTVVALVSFYLLKKYSKIFE